MNDSDTPQPGTGDTGRRQLTLLVVEDDPGLNRLIQKRLTRHGFVAEGALSGAEALRRVAELPELLILLDYRLPDMTANQLILTLAAQRRAIPFIVMTGNGDERIAVEMMKLGARDYLTKSETFLDLLPTVVIQAVERIATERRLQQAERALHEAEHRFSLLFQRIGIGIVLSTADGQILIANESILRITGYSLDVLRQTPMAALYADPAAYAAMMHAVSAEGGVREAEVTMRRKDDTRFQASCSFDTLDIEGNRTILITAEDITERIASRQRIRHLNAVLNGIRRVNRLIVEEADRDRLIQSACESLIQTFGYGNAWVARLDSQGGVSGIASAGFASNTAQQLNTIGTSNTLPWCAQQALHHTIALAIRRATACTSCMLERSCAEEPRLVIQMAYNGKIYGVMSVGLAPGFVVEQEEQNLFAEVARDLAFALYKIDIETERSKAESELQTSRESLKQALDELEQRVAERTNELSMANLHLARAVRVKDEFLANMSHELRTPLNAILGRAEMCREGFYGALSPGQSEALRTIEESGRHLLELINDVLDVAKIEAGRVDLDIELVQVDAVCEASVRLVSQQALKKRLRLTQQLDPSVGLIYADGRRLKQILVNLLSNAVKFTPEGGEIGIEVAGDREREIVSFSVWDTGGGIAAEHLSRLFQPFVQVDSSLSRAHEGTGLGLNLVLNLAKLHGGSVNVTTEVGQGSRFTAALPWRSPEAEAAVASAQPEAIDMATRPADQCYLDGPLILLAEDNEDSISLISSYLEFHGMRLAVAHNGTEAVQLAADILPAMILMDVQMPQLDGLAATRQIRAIPDLRDTPIIALTALAMPGDRERCIEAGASDYISKPISMRHLLQIISTFIEA
ncbi:response regulator [Oscillochloris sp. ZM17-4]|uniref:response regulator n=1 Tax=Oscillochloris sp. ZM17-4 TaxID=2866714 RepID=UPI001C73278E|nr:response regulator [Oscillochloris sp. ZM17-4]MBX0326775.1 response regulator [Oscillochloris sp. ZM17-4]